MSPQTSLLRPRVQFVLEMAGEIDDIPPLLYRDIEDRKRRKDFAPLAPEDAVVSIRHPRGRARVRLAALELRPANRDNWHLHVLNLAPGTRPGTSRGIYLTLSAPEAAEALDLGVKKR